MSVFCAGLITFLAIVPSARADGPTGAAATVEAKRLFSQGSALYLAGKYEEALDALEGSRKLVPSPNSELVMARCLRDLGRLVEAKAMFESAEAEARRRAAEGAPKYAQTAQSAAAEGEAVRAQLGTIHIHIDGADATTSLAVDAASTDVPPGGDLVVWHAPGEVVVSTRSARGLEQHQVVTVRAGAEVTIGFGRQEATAPEPAPPSSQPLPAVPPPGLPRNQAERVAVAEPPRAEWALPAALLSGGVALAGVGAAVGFGLDSKAEYQDLLSYCQSKGGCGPADRPRADRGKTDQTVEYASIAAASVAAAATAAFAVVAITHPARSRATSQARWQVLVGATAWGLRCDFP